MAEEQDLAALTGFTESFYRSVPELWAIYQRGKAENWTPDRLLAAMRSTAWFRANTDSSREMALLESSNSAEYRARYDTAYQRVGYMAVQLGFELSHNQRKDLALKAMRGNFSDDQLRFAIGATNAVTRRASQGKAVGGVAGAALAQMDQLMYDNGVKVARGTRASWANQIARGTLTLEQVKNEITRIAASRFPAFADRISAGETVRDIAAPYINSMAELLEISPGDIEVTDPKISQAMQAKDSKGRPTAKTLWQFEEDLRKDPRWKQTNNARETLMGVGREVASLMGLV